MTNKKICVLIVSLFFIIEFTPFVSGFTNSNSSTIVYVDGNNIDGPWLGTIEHPFKEIQDAIDLVTDGFTIHVFPYIYEEAITIEKDIKLQGEDRFSTIIKNSLNRIIKVDHAKVEISNFKFIGDYNAILVDFSNNFSFHDNIISCSYGGCLIQYSKFAEIRDNYFERGAIILSGSFLDQFNTHTIVNNTINGKPIRYYKNENGICVPEETGQVILANCNYCRIENLSLSNSGVPIQISHSSNSIIRGNHLFDNEYAIIFNTASNNYITENNLSNRRGILLNLNSENNNISNNNIESFFSSIKLDNSNFNNIYNNTIYNGNDGIYSISCSNSIVRRNIIYGHNLSTFSSIIPTGITLYGEGNQIDHNEIYENEIGIFLFGSSTTSKNYIKNNKIFENNIGLSLYGYGFLIERNNFYNNMATSIGLSFASFIKIRENNIVSKAPILLKALNSIVLAQNNYWGSESIFPPNNRMKKTLSLVFCFPASNYEFNI